LNTETPDDNDVTSPGATGFQCHLGHKKKKNEGAPAAPDVSSFGGIHIRGHATGSLFAVGSPP
jgi:hypothetical protein